MFKMNYRCFCFDGDGKRIFGEALYDESEDMTCGKMLLNMYSIINLFLGGSL